MVVFLHTSLAQQLQRVGSGRGRPMLQGADMASGSRNCAGSANRLYREIADIILSTDGRRVPKVADLITSGTRSGRAAVSA